jgi:hypothetical protein
MSQDYFHVTGGPLPQPLPPRPKSRSLPWVVAIAVGLIIAIITTVAVSTSGGGSNLLPAGIGASPSSTSAEAPRPISRAELMRNYARIAPLDKSATPETIDALAEGICGLLRQGTSTDKLISESTDVYRANATQVVQLLVSYKCPEFLQDFN